MNEISSQHFEFYQKFLLEKSGLFLTPAKTYLLQSRLTPIMQSLGYTSLEIFTNELMKTMDKSLIAAVVEGMTTNETSFFRDSKPFQQLREIMLPDLIEKRAQNKKIRILSTACSSGQEAYSIAIVLNEFFQNKPDWKYQIIGTDISLEMLEQARRGEYNQFEIQRGLTIQMMMKYFKQVGTNWQINEKIKENVSFQSANLLDSMATLGTFDIIFCRNVLIYFNPETKTMALNKLKNQLHNDGYLILGATETLLGLKTDLKGLPQAHGVYIKDNLSATVPALISSTTAAPMNKLSMENSSLKENRTSMSL